MSIYELLAKGPGYTRSIVFQQRIQSLEMCLDHEYFDWRKSSSLSGSDYCHCC